jgi:hypothetical protein
VGFFTTKNQLYQLQKPSGFLASQCTPSQKIVVTSYDRINTNNIFCWLQAISKWNNFILPQIRK